MVSNKYTCPVCGEDVTWKIWDAIKPDERTFVVRSLFGSGDTKKTAAKKTVNISCSQNHWAEYNVSG